MIEFSWLLVIILAYFLFSLSNLGDKLILAGPPKPVSYTFYVGVLSLITIVLIPFADFGLPSLQVMLWIIAEAVVFILGIYTMYSALERFEVSKVITTIGAGQPIFIFALTWLIFGAQRMNQIDILAFILLVVGSVVISIEKNSKTTESYLKITLLSSFLFSLDYVFSKMVFLEYSFLAGLIWMKIILFLLALSLLISKRARKEIFSKQSVSNKKTRVTFFFAYTFGGVATILQAFAVSLAPIAFLPIVNSLRGIQYVFLFIMTLLLSYFFPKILREKISKKIILQKIVSTILIVAGFVLLVI